MVSMAIGKRVLASRVTCRRDVQLQLDFFGGGSVRSWTDSPVAGSFDAITWMDNPWGNAWEEPATDSQGSSTWTHTTIHTDLSEGDVAPSWPTVSGIKWGEDEHASRSSNLWTQSNESLQVWTSQREHLPPEKTSPAVEPPQLPVVEQNDTTPPSPVRVDHAKESSPSSQSDDKNSAQLPLPTLSLPPPISSSPSPSTDHFGGFESAQPTDTSDPEVWASATYPPAEDAETWSTVAWGDAETKKEQQKDEWEAARAGQEKEDRQEVSRY
jgi:hypothetical protein